MYLQCFQLDDEDNLTSFDSDELDHTFPYLTNVNEDPILSHVIHHYLNTNEIIVGSPDCTTYLNGLGIFDRHAVIRPTDRNKYELTLAKYAAKVKANYYNANR